MNNSGKRETKQLIKIAYQIMKLKYGIDGYNPKPYHNEKHAKEVVASVMEIYNCLSRNDSSKITNINLVLIAAAFYDCEQDLLKPGSNEIVSSELAEFFLIRQGYFSTREVNLVKKIILSTTVTLVDGGYVVQSPTALVESKLMVDADFHLLGSKFEYFFDRSVLLYKELVEDDRIITKNSFWKNQKNLLRSHKYSLDASSVLYPNKDSNLLQLSNI